MKTPPVWLIQSDIILAEGIIKVGISLFYAEEKALQNLLVSQATRFGNDFIL